MTFDWVLAGLLVLGFILGWRKGLLGFFSGLAGLALEIYVAVHFNGRLAGMLDSNFALTDKMTEFFARHIPAVQGLRFLSAVWFPARTGSEADTFISAPAHFLSVWALYLLSFLLLFFLTKFLFRFLGRLLTRCLDHTLIGPVNRFLGGILGLVFAGLVLGLSMAGLSLLLGPGAGPPAGQGMGSYLHGALEKSHLGPYLVQIFKQ